MTQLSPPISTPSAGPDPTRRLVLYLLVAAMAIVAHFPIIYNQFVSFDDKAYIVDNQMVEQGLNPATIKWALTAHVVANWHPVTMLSHLVDGALFGLNPAGHHAMSLLLHAVNAVLLALVLNRFTGSFYRSIAVALLFAVHPIHVESIAWASERKDTLSFAFAMLTLLAYKGWLEARAELGWKHARALGRYAMLLGFYLLALLSKPTVVTLPALLLLLDFWPLRRVGGSDSLRTDIAAYLRALPSLIFEKLPIFILTLAASVTVFLVQRSSAAVVDISGLPFPARLANSIFAYIRYVAKLFFPYDLTIMYPHPSWWPASYIAGSAIALILLTAFIIWASFRCNRRYLIVGWLWFLGVMVPMIGIIQVGQQSMADRYAYITFPGLYILIVWAAADLLSRFKSASAGPALLACAVIPLALLANIQSRYWANSQTLFTRAISVTGPNPFAQCSLANELSRQGRFADAIPHYQETIRLEPTYAEAWGGYGTALYSLGQTELAEQAFEKSLSLNATLIEPRLNIARIYMQKHQDAQAEAVLTKLATDKPDVPETYFIMGQLRSRQGNLPNALAFFDLAIAKNPGYADAYNSRGTVKARMGNIPAAYEDFARAVQLQPDMVVAQENLQKAKSYLQGPAPK